MGYSFTQIERSKSQTIFWALSFLGAFYFCAIFLICFLIRNAEQFHLVLKSLPHQIRSFSLFEILIIVTVSVLTVILQWIYASETLIDQIASLMRYRIPDSNDPKEAMFQNIVDEIIVATGGRHMQAVVVPSRALNAFGIDNGDSVAIIGVTRGLLYNLNRSQLEAVVGHEAAQIVSGDCEQITLISSIFEPFAAILSGVRFLMSAVTDMSSGSNDRIGYGYGGGWSSPSTSGNRNRNGMGLQIFRLGYYLIFVVFILVIIYLVNGLATLMRMFISRNRKLRADAVAVRLTRNPMSLAEALYIMAYGRRSLFDKADYFQSLFIINPRHLEVDENDGALADLVSTHPPVFKRIQILLDMAHADSTVLDQALKDSQQRAKSMPEEEIVGRSNIITYKWFARKEKEWVGPLSAEGLQGLDWLRPDTIIRRFGGEGFTTVEQESDLKSLLLGLYARGPDALHTCPSCSGELQDKFYEGVKILQCGKCEGILAGENEIGIILQRREQKFSPSTYRLAATMLAEHVNSRSVYHDLAVSERNYRCDKCKDNEKKKMVKRFFNKFYPVEVDKCQMCGLTWFDKDELDIMQCMFEYHADNQEPAI